jgi:hypothetical protein
MVHTRSSVTIYQKCDISHLTVDSRYSLDTFSKSEKNIFMELEKQKNKTINKDDIIFQVIIVK